MLYPLFVGNFDHPMETNTEILHWKLYNNIFIKGLAKKKNSKNPRLLWKWVGGFRSHSEFVVVENLPKIALTSANVLE